MKSFKFIVGGAALIGIISVFLKWISIDGKLPKVLAGAMPESGMDNGGPVFIFLLALPLIAAGIGALKRFGRGLSALALVGSLAAAFMAMVKYDDIEKGARAAAKLGGNVTMSAAPGFWVFLIASTAALLVSLVSLVKPEPQRPSGAPAS